MSCDLSEQKYRNIFFHFELDCKINLIEKNGIIRIVRCSEYTFRKAIVGHWNFKKPNKYDTHVRLCAKKRNWHKKKTLKVQDVFAISVKRPEKIQLFTMFHLDLILIGNLQVLTLPWSVVFMKWCSTQRHYEISMTCLKRTLNSASISMTTLEFFFKYKNRIQN